MARRATQSVAFAIAAIGLGVGSAGALPTDPPVELVGLAPSVTEQISYDDNLYRLPSSVDPVTIFGPKAERGDWMNLLSVRLAGRWPAGRQDIYLDAHVDDNYFLEASDLNHVSGAGVLRWDWTAGESTGQIGVNYQRFFPGFANYRLPDLNLVTREQYFATGNFRFGPTWSINGSVQRARTFQSLPVRKIDEFSSNLGSVGLQLDTKVGNQYGIDYSYTRATFPFPTIINALPFDRDYHSSLVSARATYKLTTTLNLVGDWGYLKREYTLASAAENFSGDQWHANLIWQPDEKLMFTFLGARELTAYVDAESQYFIFIRGGMAAEWQVTRKIAIRLDAIRESRRYVADPIAPGVGSLLRRDTQNTGTLALVVAPTRSFVITTTYKYERRDSNLPTLIYDDAIASLSLLYSFR